MKLCILVIIALASLLLQEGQAIKSLAADHSHSHSSNSNTDKIGNELFEYYKNSTNENENQNDFQSRQQPSCTYSHQFSNVGETIWLQSENYPKTYPRNLRCRYSLSSPRGTQITFECAEQDFNVKYSSNCQADLFYWSLRGDPNFGDIDGRCGKGRISPQRSYGNKLELGFRSDNSRLTSEVFQYRCQIKVVPSPCSCGVSGVSSRIVGGVEAKIAEFPWRVALYTDSIGVFCGGTLISNRWVLTAAHCTNNVKGELIKADIGDHDYTILDEVDNTVIDIDRVIQNNWYNKDTQENDIALLRLKTPVTFKNNIQPACLPWKFTSRTFDGEVATASGWGTDSFGGTVSTFLKKVDLDVIGSQRCQKIYEGSKVKVTNTMLCAARPGKDTCQSDSGGSLDYRDPSTGSFYGIGIVSQGVGCAKPGNPGVYTQLINYLGWIEQNSDETYCKV